MCKKTMLTVVASIALPLASAHAQKPTNDQPDVSAIQKTIDDYCAAFNHGDIDRLLTFWADDADYVGDGGQTHRGKDAIGALFKESAENLKGWKLGLKIDSLRLAKPDVAIEDGIATLTNPDGETHSGRYTAVWIKAGDKWLISSARDLQSVDNAVSPTNADYLQPLDWLVGEWVSDDDGPTVNLTSKWAHNKNFLVQEYTVTEKDGTTDVHVTQWIGFDPASGQIKSWTFDSHGGYGEGLWTRGDNVWSAETTGVLPDGRIGESLNSARFVDDAHMEWRSTGRNIEGQPMSDAVVKFVRKDQTKKARNPQR